MTTSANPQAARTGDNELDLAALRRYLEAGVLVPAGELKATLISGGKSNLTYRITDGTTRWILRRPPLGEILAGAHDVSREHRVMAGLSGSSVPVPEVVALCEDPGVLGAPFYMMIEVPGSVLRTADQVHALPEPTRARLSGTLVDTLADLHEVDFATVGLGGLGRPEGYLDRQLGRWVRQYRKIKVRDLNAVEPLASVLADSVPTGVRPSIVHGDYRLDNVIVCPDDPAKISAVLDWEMATLGDPLADFGILIMFWDEVGAPFNPITNGLMAVPGVLSRDAVIERYITRRNLQVDNLDWYLIFARFKLAIILEQIHVRHLHGQTRGEGFGNVGEMVALLLDGAMEMAASSAALKRPGKRNHG